MTLVSMLKIATALFIGIAIGLYWAVARYGRQHHQRMVEESIWKEQALNNQQVQADLALVGKLVQHILQQDEQRSTSYNLIIQDKALATAINDACARLGISGVSCSTHAVGPTVITDLEEHKRLEDRQLQWEQHAHPLKRLTIEVQGTRHSDKEALLALVNDVSALLASGEVSGREHDDDFGYTFEYTPETNQPSIFD